MGDFKYTPMMEQYLDIKKDYKDSIVFFRLGDFYEMFFEDAHIASRELELALTGKDAGAPERVPMCGIPFHAANEYIEKLVKRGYKVAIVEQIEDPKEAVGIVKRGVIKMITPGTLSSGLNERENNFIASITYINRYYVLCYSDITTGEGYLSKFKKFDMLLNELLSLKIKEIVIDKSFNNILLKDFANTNSIMISIEENSNIDEELLFIVKNLPNELNKAVGLLLNYYEKTQYVKPKFFKEFVLYESMKYLSIDAFTKKNLEINETLRLSNRNGSLLWHLDHTETAMGSRLLSKWLNKPLIDRDLINERLDFVEKFNECFLVKKEIKAIFKNVYDLERIIARISANQANAKDLVWLRRSLERMPDLVSEIKKLDMPASNNLANNINTHRDLYELLEKALVNDPPLSVKEGGLINDGFNNELDEVRKIRTNGKDWILNYEQQERERFNIKTLKVGYNRVTGYYIEVSKGALSQIPEDSGYQRRATLANAERFISPELKHYEELVLNAKEKEENIEYEIFKELRSYANNFIKSLQELADIISEIDVYISLSDCAIKYNYVRPTFNNNREVNIVDGRHPVLSRILENDYIVNDVVINKYNTILITGPNMSGKSTYMRMLANIIIMAQMGSFVPAKVANLSIFDAIYTRIGASDDIISGQSTFMVEMSEANYAISNATKNSLVLFDEIGRGTATYDGMALAEAILEYLHEKVGCVVLFSTHYHELTALEGKLSRLKNVHVEAKETENGVAFMHKVISGPTDKSYGINVASLAGLPKSLIERSKEILLKLEETDNKKSLVTLDLFNFDNYEEKEEVKQETTASKIKNRLDEIDINNISPRDALNILYELKEIE
jgi:DNA mismatch repair protein MutS